MKSPVAPDAGGHPVGRSPYTPANRPLCWVQRPWGSLPWERWIPRNGSRWGREGHLPQPENRVLYQESMPATGKATPVFFKGVVSKQQKGEGSCAITREQNALRVVHQPSGTAKRQPKFEKGGVYTPAHPSPKTACVRCIWQNRCWQGRRRGNSQRGFEQSLCLQLPPSFTSAALPSGKFSRGQSQLPAPGKR